MNVEQIKEVYDFEGVFTKAFQKSMEEIETVLALKFRSYVDKPEFQSIRPRVEIGVMMGGSGDQLLPVRGQEANPGSCQQMTFTGQADFDLITPGVEELHSEARAIVRFHCALMKRHVNGTLLTRHKLNWFKAGGCVYAYAPAAYKTKMIFEFGFSIQADALRALETQQEE